MHPILVETAVKDQGCFHFKVAKESRLCQWSALMFDQNVPNLLFRTAVRRQISTLTFLHHSEASLLATRILRRKLSLNALKPAVAGGSASCG